MKVSEKMGFFSQKELLDASRSIRIDQEVSKLKLEQDRLSTHLDELKNKIDLVTGLEFINEDLSIFDIESAASFFGTVPSEAYSSVQKELETIPSAMLYSSGKDPINLVVVVPTPELEKFGSIIQKASLRLQRIPKLKGEPVKILSKLKEEKLQKESEMENVDENLRALAEKHYAKIVTVEEQTRNRGKKARSNQQLRLHGQHFRIGGLGSRTQTRSTPRSIRAICDLGNSVQD